MSVHRTAEPTLTGMPTRVPISDELRSALGSPTKAVLLESSLRSRVWRVGLRDGGRVIVKQITVGGGRRLDAGLRRVPGPAHGLTGPADTGTLPAWSGPTTADADSFLALAEALDVPVPPAVPTNSPA